MKRSDVAIVFYSMKNNRYSINVLVAALERDDRTPVDVYIVDERRQITLLNTLQKLRSLYKKTVLAISFFTTQLPFVEKLVDMVKKFLPEVLVIAGGPHATGDPLGTITKLKFDYAAIGEGEETIMELAIALADNSPLEDVCGIAYYDESLDKVVVNKRLTLVNLNDYPPFPYWRGRFNPIEIMRGCPWACKYCQVSFMFKAKPRYRDVDVVEYYSRIMLKRGLGDLRFIAPDSFAYMSLDGREPNPNAVEELLERLHKLVQRYKGRIFYGTFPSEVRPNSVDHELARIARRYVANKSIIIGAQTGSDRLLKLINRGHTVDDIIYATETLIKAGFRVDVDLIFGLPGETREDIEDTLKVVEKLVKMGARIHAHTFMPLPGTPFADAPPGRIEPWLRKRLYLLLGRGFLYGDWLEQEREAEMIDWYRRVGIIFTGKSLSMNTKIRYCGKQ